ncbi:Phosphoacetylglucosamine Mutase [Asimina triloba]
MTSHNGASDNGVKIVDPHGSMMMQDWESFASATVNAGDVEDLVQVKIRSRYCNQETLVRPLKSSNSHHMKDEVMKVQVALLFLPFNSADPVTQFSPITGECIPTASLTSMLEEKLGISANKTGKLNNFGGLFLDKKCKSFSEPIALNLKSSKK